MACALRPADFAGGPDAPDGKGWILGNDTYDTNPRLLIGPGERAMIRLWRAARGHYGNGLGGGIVLPEAGGLLDQAAILLDAFDVMDAAEAQLRAQWGELLGGNR